MFGTFILVLVFGASGFTSVKLARWYRNYHIAQQCGWPVFASPVHFANPLWMFLGPLFVPLLRLLPKSWTEPWLSISQIFQVWKAGYQPFQHAGSETFILATPDGNILWTSDGTVIHQLLTSHPKCQLATELVEFFKICGPNVGVTEGDDWKLHRRIVMSGLGHSINTRTWRESLDQTEKLISQWMEKEGAVVNTMADWTSKLALHVLAHGLFDITMHWDDGGDGGLDQPSGRHQMSFDRALRKTIQHLPVILMTPPVLLENLPIQAAQEVSTAFKETGFYLDDMREQAGAQVDVLAEKKNKSLLEAIVVAGKLPQETGNTILSEESVKGNLFFTLVAGHHTLGSILGFILVLMAVYPDAQERLQAQLDQVFGSRSRHEWSMEKDFKNLQSGYLGAIQKEVSSLYHPVQFIPRTAAEQLTIRDSSNISHVIPAGTLTMISMPAANQNPALWDKRPRVDDIDLVERARLSRSPALYFNPERWLSRHVSDGGRTIDADDRDSTSWFTFSQGARACPGRSLAQTEMTAVMASIFKDYSLELVVNDDMVTRCGGDTSLAIRRTRDDAIKMLYDDIEFLMALKLKHRLPIRIRSRVPR